jgi:hypothetical protein
LASSAAASGIADSLGSRAAVVKLLAPPARFTAGGRPYYPRGVANPSPASTILIPYGAGRLPADAFAAAAGADGSTAAICRLRHIAIAPESGAPLRLDSGQLEFRDGPTAQSLADAADQIDCIRRLLRSYCDTFRRSPKLFLDRYFAFVLRQIEAHRGELEAMLAPFGGMYDVRHWAFSAWLPIPQAHLDVRARPGDGPPAIEDMVRVDFAFWSGARLIAVDIGDAMASRARRAALERARQAGVLVVEAPKDGLTEELFGAPFPPAFARFWAGRRYPSGPFKPQGLPNSLQ